MKRFLSLGWGVQSTALLMLAEEGKIEPFDAAFHADTMIEGEEVYAWRDRVAPRCKTPIVTSSYGDLGQDVLDGLKNGTRFANMPLWTLGKEGKPAPIQRQCTPDYKIMEVRRSMRKFLGYSPTDRIKERIELVIGFSIEEKERMAESEVNYIVNDFPLIYDLWWTRKNCSDYLGSIGLPNAPKSACYVCPFKSNAEWRRLRDHWPEEWQKAIAFDRAIRKHPGMRGDLYLHRDLMPLDQADLENDQFEMSFNCGAGGCGL